MSWLFSTYPFGVLSLNYRCGDPSNLILYHIGLIIQLAIILKKITFKSQAMLHLFSLY